MEILKIFSSLNTQLNSQTTTLCALSVILCLNLFHYIVMLFDKKIGTHLILPFTATINGIQNTFLSFFFNIFYFFSKWKELFLLRIPGV